MTSSSFDVDIIDNTTQDGIKMFSVTIRLISTCLPITIKSDNTSVTIIDDEGILVVLDLYVTNFESLFLSVFSPSSAVIGYICFILV